MIPAIEGDNNDNNDNNDDEYPFFPSSSSEDWFSSMQSLDPHVVIPNIPAERSGDFIRPQKVQRIRANETIAIATDMTFTVPVPRPSKEDDTDIYFPPNHFYRPTEFDPSKVDSIIAQEMAAMSMEDREKVLYDIHGISDQMEETPELLQFSFHLLELELAKLRNAPAYEMARQMNRTYVDNETFRLKFLRAELFVPAKAAERMAIHFEVKLELFGLDLLTKDIIQDHLDKDTIDVVHSGKIQGLPQRDRAGRLVGIRFQQPMTVPVLAQLRAIFYFGMVASEDEETQKKGHALVSYLVGQEPNLLHSFYYRRELNLKMPRMLDAVPIRYVGIHVCHDYPVTWRLILAIFKLAAKQTNRIRMREHCGDREECMLSLRSFGIPTHDFPLDEQGNIMTDFHKNSMEKRRKLERLRQQQMLISDSSSSSQHHPTVPAELQLRVITPGNNDVLLGRGKASYQHIGNVRLRRMIEEKGPAYEEANMVDKAKMSAEIVESIRQSTGRFLKEDGIGWSEVTDQVAKRKVAHAFRTLRSRYPSLRDKNSDSL